MAYDLSRRRLLEYSGVVTAALAGCSGGGNEGSGDGGSQPTATDAETPTTTPTSRSKTTASGESTVSLSVQDVETNDRTVTIPSVTIDGDGWLVVHPEAEGGGPNGKVVLAKKQLSAGTHEDVELSFDGVTSDSATLYAMLHYDDPGDGAFTFPENGDPPVTGDGSPVVKPFDVTIEEDTSDVTTVKAVDTSFDPIRASIQPGTTVRWTNEDSYGHDVTSSTFHDAATKWDFSASLAADGGTAEYTFDEAGIYEYHCTIHGEGTMCGGVLVGDVTLDEDLPCESGSSGY